jgi:hypothetical protein
MAEKRWWYWKKGAGCLWSGKANGFEDSKVPGAKHPMISSSDTTRVGSSPSSTDQGTGLTQKSLSELQLDSREGDNATPDDESKNYEPKEVTSDDSDATEVQDRPATGPNALLGENYASGRDQDFLVAHTGGENNINIEPGSFDDGVDPLEGILSWSPDQTGNGNIVGPSGRPITADSPITPYITMSKRRQRLSSIGPLIGFGARPIIYDEPPASGRLTPGAHTVSTWGTSSKQLKSVEGTDPAVHRSEGHQVSESTPLVLQPSSHDFPFNPEAGTFNPQAGAINPQPQIYNRRLSLFHQNLSMVHRRWSFYYQTQRPDQIQNYYHCQLSFCHRQLSVCYQQLSSYEQQSSTYNQRLNSYRQNHSSNDRQPSFYHAQLQTTAEQQRNLQQQVVYWHQQLSSYPLFQEPNELSHNPPGVLTDQGIMPAPRAPAYPQNPQPDSVSDLRDLLGESDDNYLPPLPAPHVPAPHIPLNLDISTQDHTHIQNPNPPREANTYSNHLNAQPFQPTRAELDLLATPNRQTQNQYRAPDRSDLSGGARAYNHPPRLPQTQRPPRILNFLEDPDRTPELAYLRDRNRAHGDLLNVPEHWRGVGMHGARATGDPRLFRPSGSGSQRLDGQRSSKYDHRKASGSMPGSSTKKQQQRGSW